MVLRFGKYQGRHLEDVPQDYLEYMVRKCEEDATLYRNELHRRQLLEEAEMPMMERLVQAGWRQLAQQHHPDKGGDTAAFQRLQAAYEQLRAVLKEVKQIA